MKIFYFIDVHIKIQTKISFIKWMYILEERDRTKYLGLLSSDEKNERIFDRIRYLT